MDAERYSSCTVHDDSWSVAVLRGLGAGQERFIRADAVFCYHRSDVAALVLRWLLDCLRLFWC